MSTAQHTPGPWFSSPDSATGKWVVVRKRNAPPSWHPFEPLKDALGKERLFTSESEANAAIAKTTGSAA